MGSKLGKGTIDSYVATSLSHVIVIYCILDLYNVDDTFLSIIVLNGFDTGIMRNRALSVFQQGVKAGGDFSYLETLHALGRDS